MATPSLLKTRFRLTRARTVWTLAVVLMAGSLAVFWPVRHDAFINYDDQTYISDNPHVLDGMTWEGIGWAASAGLFADSPNADYWIPVTFLSHLLTVQLFGMGPAAHHLVNAVLHAVNAALLFLLLQRMTGAVWRSGIVAALFAVHPLHVESVAWVTERKDVLSGLFFMLTLLAYVRYAEHPTVSRYLLVVPAFALGLMSKPILVIVPCLLLLLDFWPLGRVASMHAKGSSGWHTAWRLAWEKMPLFALSACAAMITYLATQRKGGVASFEGLPWPARVDHALVSTVSYLRKTVWPDGLAVFYPYPVHGVPAWQVVGAALVIITVSILVLRAGRQRPYLIVGWLWYLVALMPVIGVIQAGEQAMADRYMYLPAIGVFVMAAWGLPDATAAWRYRTLFLPAAAIIAIAACLVLTRLQLRYWRDSTTLFEHALRVTDGNYVAYNQLGLALADEGRVQEAIDQYRMALSIRPDFPSARYNIGNALAHEGRDQEAIWQYRQALRINPRDDMAQNNWGMVLGNEGRLDDAIVHFTEALRINPGLTLARNNLGLALARQGHFDAAISQFNEALRLEPRNTDAHDNLGSVYARMGRLDDAIREYETLLAMNPQFPGARTNLERLADQKKEKGTPEE
jgi:tetratricopeptide (TPR) repeat protein